MVWWGNIKLWPHTPPPTEPVDMLGGPSHSALYEFVKLYIPVAPPQTAHANVHSIVGEQQGAPAPREEVPKKPLRDIGGSCEAFKVNARLP